MSRLLEAEVDGERLTEAEILAFFQLLIVAGTETTVDLINNAILCLVENPDQLARVRAAPDLLPSTIEEVLRYRTPVQWGFRATRSDVDLRGKTISRGKLVLPGLVASDTSTRPLRDFLNNRGYAAHGWRQGRNFGLRDGVREDMVDLVEELNDSHGRKVSLVGWSLGGLYARQLAKTMPDRVRSVITLGSPFASSPKATNAWRVYEMASGRRADEEAAPCERLVACGARADV